MYRKPAGSGSKDVPVLECEEVESMKSYSCNKVAEDGLCMCSTEGECEFNSLYNTWTDI